MNSAIELFGQHGYRATSTEAISEKAGYSQATLFFHFNNKKGLLESCFDFAIARLKSIGIEETSSTSLIRYLERMDTIFENQVLADFISRMLLEAHGNKELLSTYSHFHQKIGSQIAKLLVMETNVSEQKADFVADALLCMSLGVHSKQRTEINKFTREEYRRMLTLVGEALLAYLRSKGPVGI